LKGGEGRERGLEEKGLVEKYLTTPICSHMFLATGLRRWLGWQR
jgi:hypothetical protein